MNTYMMIAQVTPGEVVGFFSGVFLLVVIGFIAGSIAGFLVPGDDPSGCLFNVLIGVVGAIIGGAIFHLFGLESDRVFVRYLAPVLGAMIILIVLRLVGVTKESPVIRWIGHYSILISIVALVAYAIWFFSTYQA